MLNQMVSYQVNHLVNLVQRAHNMSQMLHDIGWHDLKDRRYDLR